MVITEDQMRLIYDIWQRPCEVYLTLIVYTVHEFGNDTNIQVRVQNYRGLTDFVLEYDNGKQQQYILSLTYNHNSYETFAKFLSQLLSLPRYQERIKKANSSGIFEEERDIKIMTYMNSIKDGQVIWEEEL